MRRGTSARFLSVYLNDHLMGSTAVIEVVRRASREHAGTELGAFLSRLAREIAEDRQALRRLMAAVGALRDQRPPGSSAVDLDALLVRAQRQLDEVERHRVAAGAALHR